jgi:protein-disulfide isomerase
MKQCPFCKRQFEDLLKHLVIVHDIEDTDQFKREVAKLKAKEQMVRKFADYIMKLREQRAKGLISAEEYRARMKNWPKNQ